ncbi:MAG: gamma-glutamylcyclotransferase [Chitinophagaceae bacterium]|nr:gamma-glutamylcyclotransferase [Chitinophagaceae bacterium]MBN8666665.1 gamma-glutamylcyclotransferase [Chitinophagales bacterium]
MTPHLFVYGSLRKGFQSPVYEYISRYFHYLGEARVPGKLVDMGDYPAAVPDGEHWILGELYIIKNPDEFGWAFGQLDDYEGVNVEEGETQLYRRELAEIHTPEGTVHAWIYWYNQDVSGRPIIASGDILQYIAEKNK